MMLDVACTLVLGVATLMNKLYCNDKLLFVLHNSYMSCSDKVFTKDSDVYFEQHIIDVARQMLLANEPYKFVSLRPRASSA